MLRTVDCSVGAHLATASACHHPLVLRVVVDAVVCKQGAMLLAHVRPGDRHTAIPVSLAPSTREETLPQRAAMKAGLASALPAAILATLPVLLAAFLPTGPVLEMNG